MLRGASYHRPAPPYLLRWGFHLVNEVEHAAIGAWHAPMNTNYSVAVVPQRKKIIRVFNDRRFHLREVGVEFPSSNRV